MHGSFKGGAEVTGWNIAKRLKTLWTLFWDTHLVEMTMLSILVAKFSFCSSVPQDELKKSLWPCGQ